MNRKDFIKTCGVICLSTLPIALSQTGCSSAVYNARYTRIKDSILIPRSEFYDVQNGSTSQRPFIVVTPQGERYPIAVYAMPDGTYSALLLRCTHKSCELQPESSYLICPCHGSEFTTQGKVQSPPAQKDLQTYHVVVEGSNIAIQL